MNTLRLALSATLAAGLLAACGDDDDDNGGVDAGTTTDTGGGGSDAGPSDTGTGDAGTMDSGTSTGTFTPPPNTVPVNFTIDDSANQTYTSTDGLAWLGGFEWDSTTREAMIGDFTQPIPVFDDGPWNMGGHEPADAQADDNIWGVTAFFQIPTGGDESFEYGAIQNLETTGDTEWIWGQQSDMNGTFTIPTGATDPIDAAGLVIPAFGNVDFRLILDTGDLAMGFENVGGQPVFVKSNRWAFQLAELNDAGTDGDETPGDGLYTFRLGATAGTGVLRHAGLLASGGSASFIFQFGDATGPEYKGEEGGMSDVALTQGVTAEVSTDGGSTWMPVVPGRLGNGDTIVTAP